MLRVICWESLSVLVAWEKRAKNPGAGQVGQGGCSGGSASLSPVQNRKQRRNHGAKAACEPCKGGGDCRQLLSPQKGTPRNKSQWEQELPAR